MIVKKGLGRSEMFFDKVFPKEATQEDVYEMVKGTTQDLNLITLDKETIEAVMSGYNGTVFA